VKLAEGSVAIVTGGGSGLGRETCVRLAEEGARAIIVADRQPGPKDGETTVDLIRAKGVEAIFVETDVTRAADVDRAIGAAQAFGGVTTLITFAGILQNGELLDISEDEFDAILSVNIKGSFLIAQAASRAMINRGNQGAIVLVSSIGGLRGSGVSVAYSASKGAVMLMGYAMADALAPHGIRVNVLHPGFIRTPMTKDIDLADMPWKIALDRARSRSIALDRARSRGRTIRSRQCRRVLGQSACQLHYRDFAACRWRHG